MSTPDPTDAQIEQAIRNVDDDTWAAIEAEIPNIPAMVEQIVWKGGETNAEGVTSFPWVDYGPAISALQGKIYAANFLPVFDWAAWEGTQRFQKAPESLSTASVADAARFMTAFNRGDRFTEGTLEAAYKEGWVSAILTNISNWRAANR